MLRDFAFQEYLARCQREGFLSHSVGAKGLSLILEEILSLLA